MPALRRAVAVLDYISEACGEVSAARLAQDLKIPKSTLHGLLSAMEELGLIYRDRLGRIQTGARPLAWSRDFVAKSDLASAFHRYFNSPQAQQGILAGYTMTMTILDGANVVYIACSQAHQPLGVTFQVGMRLPAPFTATGKILLAALPEAELATTFAGTFPPPLTRLSVRDLAALRAVFPAQEARGYSVDDGEVREGMICLGAAICDHSRHVKAALALSVTRPEAKAAQISTLGMALKGAADQISHLLGAP
ncbi:IclR family transcriptional regulator (plasmid) [Thioclava litoralis]|uniref:IclR family transcriptional regulator n=1 Tax=Thioclava litoralis TaxID=3076557 RepID=A0ABZ1E736_9RHOB|nr:IclR family transcriptional regulator [Thioclava sp. FTW29]